MRSGLFAGEEMCQILRWLMKTWADSIMPKTISETVKLEVLMERCELSLYHGVRSAVRSESVLRGFGVRSRGRLEQRDTRCNRVSTSAWSQMT